jgi:hypothetical protein
MYMVMILLLICQLMCATIPGAHIRCMHSILSFNWSVTQGLDAFFQGKIILSVVPNLFFFPPRAIQSGHGSWVGVKKEELSFGQTARVAAW